MFDLLFYPPLSQGIGYIIGYESSQITIGYIYEIRESLLVV